MEISPNGWLIKNSGPAPIYHYPSPHFWPGYDTDIGPFKGIVLHYTALLSGYKTTKWLQRTRRSVSTHLIVDHDGTIYQLVSFCNRAWHCARKGLVWNRPGTQEALSANPNNFFLGLDFANVGYLQKKGDRFYYWPGNFKPVFHGPVLDLKTELSGYRYWEKYTEIQLQVMAELVGLIARRFNIDLDWLVDHHYLDPENKWDCLNLDFVKFKALIRTRITADSMP